MNYAVFGCDAKEDYAFPTPISCAMWVRNGYKPLLIAVGPGWESPRAALSLEAAKALGARVETCPVSGIYPTEWWAKIVRLTACLLVEPEDELTTTDADMVVLDASFMQWREGGRHFHIWYSNAYGELEPHVYPMCYLTAPAHHWKRLVQPDFDSLPEATKRLLDRFGKMSNNQRSGRFSDEYVLASMLVCWKDYPWGVQFASREQKCLQFPERRIDRKCVDVDRAIDFHLPHPAFGDKEWLAIKRIVFPRLNPEQRRQLDEYRDAYVKLETHDAAPQPSNPGTLEKHV
jgi:hypothetical protein